MVGRRSQKARVHEGETTNLQPQPNRERLATCELPGAEAARNSSRPSAIMGFYSASNQRHRTDPPAPTRIYGSTPALNLAPKAKVGFHLSPKTRNLRKSLEARAGIGRFKPRNRANSAHFSSRHKPNTALTNTSTVPAPLLTFLLTVAASFFGGPRLYSWRGSGAGRIVGAGLQESET